jgi:hypothetical protein
MGQGYSHCRCRRSPRLLRPVVANTVAYGAAAGAGAMVHAVAMPTSHHCGSCHLQQLQPPTVESGGTETTKQPIEKKRPVSELIFDLFSMDKNGLISTNRPLDEVVAPVEVEEMVLHWTGYPSDLLIDFWFYLRPVSVHSALLPVGMVASLFRQGFQLTPTSEPDQLPVATVLNRDQVQRPQTYRLVVWNRQTQRTLTCVEFVLPSPSKIANVEENVILSVPISAHYVSSARSASLHLKLATLPDSVRADLQSLQATFYTFLDLFDNVSIRKGPQTPECFAASMSYPMYEWLRSMGIPSGQTFSCREVRLSLRFWRWNDRMHLWWHCARLFPIWQKD